MDPNRIEGKAKELKGEVKDTVGKITGDKSMQIEGKMDKAVGKVQDAYGRAKDNIKEQNEKWHQKRMGDDGKAREPDPSRENPDL